MKDLVYRFLGKVDLQELKEIKNKSLNIKPWRL